jgi:hypothetical protein
MLDFERSHVENSPQEEGSKNDVVEYELGLGGTPNQKVHRHNDLWGLDLGEGAVRTFPGVVPHEARTQEECRTSFANRCELVYGVADP